VKDASAADGDNAQKEFNMESGVEIGVSFLKSSYGGVRKAENAV